jgi:acetyltransferase-like isoleucine patch superfamily enzyme
MRYIKGNAVVETNQIGHGSIIEEFSIIRRDVKLGKNVHIFPNVIIENNVEIGNNVRIYPGTYIGKIPDGAGALAREPIFVKKIKIGNDCAIGPNAVIYYDVEVGNDTLVGDGASIREECRIGNFTIIGRYVTLNYNVVIGDKTKIMDHSWMAGNMNIGNDVFIGGGVITSNDNNMEKRTYSPAKVFGPTLEDHCSVGSGSVILPNIKVGRFSIVAAGAVVTKDVPDYAVVMGTPARIVRYLSERGEGQI